MEEELFRVIREATSQKVLKARTESWEVSQGTSREKRYSRQRCPLWGLWGGKKHGVLRNWYVAYVAGTQRLTLRMTEEKRREKGEQARYCRGPVMGSLSVIVSLQGFEQIFVFINPPCTWGWGTMAEWGWLYSSLAERWWWFSPEWSQFRYIYQFPTSKCGRPVRYVTTEVAIIRKSQWGWFWYGSMPRKWKNKTG